MEIVIMHCYETVLKSNNFKKHVFTSATDQSMSRIALYEYLGTYDLPSTDFPTNEFEQFRRGAKRHKANKPEALKSLYRSPGYKKNQLALCKNYVLQW